MVCREVRWHCIRQIFYPMVHCSRAGLENLQPSRCCQTTAPIIPDHWPQWLGLMGTGIQKHLMGHRFPTPYCRGIWIFKKRLWGRSIAYNPTSVKILPWSGLCMPLLMRAVWRQWYTGTYCVILCITLSISVSSALFLKLPVSFVSSLPFKSSLTSLIVFGSEFVMSSGSSCLITSDSKPCISESGRWYTDFFTNQL